MPAEFRDTSAAQDWSALRRHLAAAGWQLDDVEPRQFAGGAANLNYLISLDSSPVVLRRPPPGQLAEGASDMAREWRVLSTLPPHYGLAPQGLLFCDDSSVLGAPFQLIEYRDGLTIGGQLPAALQGRAECGSALTAALVDALATLHRLDPDEVGLGTLGRPDGFLERQVEGWARRAEVAYEQSAPPEVVAIVSWLRQCPPEPVPASLIHGDLKLDNMIVDPETLAPVAVVDWDMATRGDPLFDVAVLASYWVDETDPSDLRRIGQLPSLEPGFGTRAELVHAYFSAAGTSPRELGFLLTLARLRLAIAWQQLNLLYRRGALADPQATASSTMSPRPSSRGRRTPSPRRRYRPVPEGTLMIDFSVHAELAELGEQVRSFVEESIVPYERDPRLTQHGPNESLRDELVELARARGLLTIQAPARVRRSRPQPHRTVHRLRSCRLVHPRAGRDELCRPWTRATCSCSTRSPRRSRPSITYAR